MSNTSYCYIHIGVPKTGTTFLQQLFVENRDVLAKCGILYPDSSLRGFGHHDIAYLLAGGYPHYATPQMQTLDELATALCAEVSDHNGSIIISSENFYLFPQPRLLYDFLEKTGCLYERDIAIIVYVRRQDEAHESWYNQTIKAQGYTHDLQTCINASYDLWDYEKQLTAWSTVFGESTLIVRPYEDQQFAGGSLVTDFCSIINVSVDFLRIPNERINSGLNRDVLEFQRIVNKLPMSVQEKRRFHHQLIELSVKSAHSGLFNEEPAIDPSLRRSLLAKYASGNKHVARMYLGRETLFFNSMSHESHQAPTTTPVLTPETLALILGWLFIREP